MDTELIPDELHDNRREQWCAALRILDGVVYESGFVKATLSAYAGMALWELTVSHQDGERTVYGPDPVGNGTVMDSWFACHLEVEIMQICLQDLSEWMECWSGFDQVFFPALLIEGADCRSHRVGDIERFTFVWE